MDSDDEDGDLAMDMDSDGGGDKRESGTANEPGFRL